MVLHFNSTFIIIGYTLNIPFNRPKPIILLAVTIDNVLCDKFNFDIAEFAISFLVQMGLQIKQWKTVKKFQFQKLSAFKSNKDVTKSKIPTTWKKNFSLFFN